MTITAVSHTQSWCLAVSAIILKRWAGCTTGCIAGSMQMSPAKRRLSGPARMLMTSLGWNFSKSSVWFEVPEGCALIFGVARIPITVLDRSKKAFMPRTCSIRSAVCIELRRVTDRQTDRHGAIWWSGVRCRWSVDSLPKRLRDPSNNVSVFGRLLKTFFFSEY